MRRSAKAKVCKEAEVRTISLTKGLFVTEEEAAIAYNAAAEMLLGAGNYIPNKIV